MPRLERLPTLAVRIALALLLRTAGHALLPESDDPLLAPRARLHNVTLRRVPRRPARLVARHLFLHDSPAHEITLVGDGQFDNPPVPCNRRVLRFQLPHRITNSRDSTLPGAMYRQQLKLRSVGSPSHTLHSVGGWGGYGED
jgi:hypothetical protein